MTYYDVCVCMCVFCIKMDLDSYRQLMLVRTPYFPERLGIGDLIGIVQQLKTTRESEEAKINHSSSSSSTSARIKVVVSGSLSDSDGEGDEGDNEGDEEEDVRVPPPRAGFPKPAKYDHTKKEAPVRAESQLTTKDTPTISLK